jgi:hypothetical protein
MISSAIIKLVMKIKSKLNPSFLLDLTEVNERNQEVKFDLYVQLRKIKQITQTLSQALVSRQTFEKDWLMQNQDVIESLLNDLLDDSLLVLDGVQLDAEGIDLSLNLMNDIDLTLNLMQRLVSDEESLEN